MLLTCRSTVRSLIPSSAAIARFVMPAASSRRTSTSARREAVGSVPRSRATTPRGGPGPAPRPSRRRPDEPRRTRAPPSPGRRAADSAIPINDSDARRLVRRVQAAARPWLPGATPECARASPSASRTAPSARAAMARRSGASATPAMRARSVRRGASRRAVAGGERDLDGGLEQPRPRDLVRAPRPPPGGSTVDAAFDLALRESKQGQTRLRPSSPLAGLAIGIVGLGERAAQSMELGLLVERLPDGGLGRWPRQPVAVPGAPRRSPPATRRGAAAARPDRRGTGRGTGRGRAANRTSASSADPSTPAHGGGRRSTGTPRSTAQ